MWDLLPKCVMTVDNRKAIDVYNKMFVSSLSSCVGGNCVSMSNSAWTLL